MKYDVAVIGGGPAGLMAAGRAAERGAKVVLLEKNKSAGRKLLITGGGRCNITNNIVDPKQLASNYGLAGRFLISAFSRFGIREVIDFFNDRGVKTKIEKNNQIFPVSDQANSVLEALLAYYLEFGGELQLNAEVKKIIKSENLISKIILANGEEIEARNYIVTTGGKSYPDTGSTGDGYHWLEELGHSIIPLRPALVAITVKENYIRELEGLSLPDINLKYYSSSQPAKKIASERGDLIFTADGVSGPAAINLSRHISLASNGSLEIDLFPEADERELYERLRQIFDHGQKLAKNSLEELLPSRLVSVVIKLAQVRGDKQGNAVTRAERLELVRYLKHFKLSLVGLGDFSQAVITAGGVELKEVDPKTMRSTKIDNLFLAGEILDAAGPTGGYNLQICWSTGFVAGEAAATRDN